jgi:hypothetical protein
MLLHKVNYFLIFFNRAYVGTEIEMRTKNIIKTTKVS